MSLSDPRDGYRRWYRLVGAYISSYFPLLPSPHSCPFSLHGSPYLNLLTDIFLSGCSRSYIQAFGVAKGEARCTTQETPWKEEGCCRERVSLYDTHQRIVPVLRSLRMPKLSMHMYYAFRVMQLAFSRYPFHLKVESPSHMACVSFQEYGGHTGDEA
jgi:hypothetical protein